MSDLGNIVTQVSALSLIDRQKLYALLSVEFGGQPPAKPVATAATVPKRGQNLSSNGSSKPRKNARKGNPARKSQFATHPLYQEYKRLQKVVKAESKEQKVPVSQLSTPMSNAYRLAFTAWVEAKSAFRGRKTTEDKTGGTRASTQAGQMDTENSVSGDSTSSGEPTLSTKRRRVENAISFAEIASLPAVPQASQPSGKSESEKSKTGKTRKAAGASESLVAVHKDGKPNSPSPTK
jgi:hypothetical protein